ncbi:hypothetical protein DLM75_18015 [Leptospira stimsonii]|uniref:Uncharacterized protein n=1 Tax=Leptospira stimsonii TaxID=2202203 RepID=A0A396Z0W7_9LEPT|nr:hypothetical protein DLM75_18015 [Leptospira stimsonii]
MFLSIGLRFFREEFLYSVFVNARDFWEEFSKFYRSVRLLSRSSHTSSVVFNFGTCSFFLKRKIFPYFMRCGLHVRLQEEFFREIFCRNNSRASGSFFVRVPTFQSSHRKTPKTKEFLLFKTLTVKLRKRRSSYVSKSHCKTPKTKEFLLFKVTL